MLDAAWKKCLQEDPAEKSTDLVMQDLVSNRNSRCVVSGSGERPPPPRTPTLLFCPFFCVARTKFVVLFNTRFWKLMSGPSPQCPLFVQTFLPQFVLPKVGLSPMSAPRIPIRWSALRYGRVCHRNPHKDDSRSNRQNMKEEL